jgi:hypothetical protein
MRMRQSLAELEAAFVEEAEEDRVRRERLARRTVRRAHERDRERLRRGSSLRFVALLLTLLATAVLVAIAMFQTLAYVMG